MTSAMPAPLTTLFLAALLAIAVSGCGVAIGDDATERFRTESVPVADLRAIEVASENGAIEVVGGAHDTVEITARLREQSDGDARFTVDDDGSRLTVDGTCEASWWSDCSVGFEIAVPIGFDVDVETDSGRIDVRRVTGGVRTESDNGAITATQLGGDVAVARTDNGRIELDFVSAPSQVAATTDNGAIDIRLADDAEAYDVDVDTHNGAVDVDLRTASDAPRRITARSDNGAVEIGYRPD